MAALPLRTWPLACLLLAALSLTACSGSDNKEEQIPFGLKSEVVVTPADHVSDIVFAPDGRMFYAEQLTGAIRVVSATGQPLPEPFAQLDVATWLNLDWGLTGLAIDPNFTSNHYLYAFYTAPAEAAAAPRLQQPAQIPTPSTAGQQPTPSPSPKATASAAASPSGTQAGTATAVASAEATETAGAEESATEAASPVPVQRPQGKPVLVRFTDKDSKGTEMTVISSAFPATSPAHTGYNANGNIHFGPDGYLYASIGDYDYPPKESPVQDLSNPIGKLLRIDPKTGEAAPGNPFAGTGGADPRVFALGFREPFDFAFHPSTGAIYGTDNTPVTCEELNIIKPGANYGWPNVGEFPYSDCNAGKGEHAIYLFAREGKQPGEFISFVEVSGLAFVSGSRYPSLGDSLFACESHYSIVENVQSPGVLRRLVLSGPAYDSVSASDVIVRDCKGDVSTAPDGTVYYANNTEIRRLLPGAGGTAGTATFVAAGTATSTPKR